MVVIACIAGNAYCAPPRFSEMTYATEDSCFDKMKEVTRAITKEFALDPSLKGKAVEYDVSCMTTEQIKFKFGAVPVKL
jgi:hypothetical protein